MGLLGSLRSFLFQLAEVRIIRVFVMLVRVVVHGRFAFGLSGSEEPGDQDQQDDPGNKNEHFTGAEISTGLCG